MKLRRVGAIVLRQFYLMRASPTRLVPAFAWSAIDIVLWGFITRYLATLSMPGRRWRSACSARCCCGISSAASCTA